MAIPPLNADGLLFIRLEELVADLKKSSVIIALVVNGSFVTGKAAPNDVDVLIVLGTGHDWQADLRPGDYALLSHSLFRRRFGFDVLVAEDGSELYWKYVRFYSQSRELPDATRGILRIEL